MNDVKEKFNTLGHSNYEHDRWFSSRLAKAGYRMTRMTIEKRFLKRIQNPLSYIEVGAGPGTWTNIFQERFPRALIHLVDISSEMLNQARDRLGDRARYYESDFVLFETEARYDAFFSSRAFEYMENKTATIKKSFSLLNQGGVGCVITKMPRYQLAKAKGKEISDIHRGQILPQVFKDVLGDCGARDIKIYPATVTFPLVRSATLNMLCYRLISACQVNIFTRWLCESYCVTFRK